MAREIGAVLPPVAEWPDDARILALFLKRLVAAIRRLPHDTVVPPYTVADLCDRVLIEPKEVRRRIRQLDDDDGWPASRKLCCLVGITCALEHADQNSRWLAEAALNVADQLLMFNGTHTSATSAAGKAWVAAQLDIVLVTADR